MSLGAGLPDSHEQAWLVQVRIGQECVSDAGGLNVGQELRRIGLHEPTVQARLIGGSGNKEQRRALMAQSNKRHDSGYVANNDQFS